MKINTTTIKKVGIVILALMAISVTFVAIPNKFTSFQGEVKINGQYAQTGLSVRGCIGDESKGYIPSGQNGTYPSGVKTYYAIDVWNGTNGENVTFRIDGLLANEVGIYNDAPGQVEQNLTVTAVYNYTITLHEGWNLISLPIEPQYDGCLVV